jgi:hypothetical protein
MPWGRTAKVLSGKIAALQSGEVAEVERTVVKTVRKRGRVVDGTSLENWQWGNPFVSSNLTASANHEFGSAI